MTNKKMIYYYNNWLTNGHIDLVECYKRPSAEKIAIYNKIKFNFPTVRILGYNSQKFTVGYIDLLNADFIVDTGYGHKYKMPLYKVRSLWVSTYCS